MKKKPVRRESEKISISLPTWMNEELEQIAAENGLAKSTVVAEAIRSYYGITRKGKSAGQPKFEAGPLGGHLSVTAKTKKAVTGLV